MYHDRAEAGEILAARLEHWRGADAVVLALPRGGVPVAAPVARALGLPLGLMLVRKIGLPHQPELAVAAIAGQRGETLVVNDAVAGFAGIGRDEIERLARPERAELERRRDAYAAPALALKGRTVIVVDDGLATGTTMRAAVRALRSQGARHLVVAIPVAARDALDLLEPSVDEIVCPQVPAAFNAVGAHYRSFPQVTDAEVIALLHPAAPAPVGPGRGPAGRAGT